MGGSLVKLYLTVDPMRPHVPGTYLPDAPACARHSIMVVEVSPSAE